MKKLILYLLSKYVGDWQFRIQASKVLQNGVKEEFNEQTPYGCLYEGVGEYIESCDLFKTADVNIIKRGIMSQIDISKERINNEGN